MKYVKLIVISIILLMIILIDFNIPKIAMPTRYVKSGLKRVLISKNNTVFIKGVITSKTIRRSLKELLQLSKKLDPSDTIYVVLNSGGGLVDAGNSFIKMMNSVPQKIVTISVFAFSMAFSIFQHGDKRYILHGSKGGQHKASGGSNGSFPKGSLESRIKLSLSMLNMMHRYEAKRMGISKSKFEKMIDNEMWLYDNDWINVGAADEKVIAVCETVDFCPVY